MSAEFIEEVMKAAAKIQKEYALPAATITAQACLETGYGKKVCVDINTGQYSYNLFNLKGRDGPAGGVLVYTTEYYDGKNPTRIKAYFRAYHNFNESFEDYVELISRKRFAPCREAAGDPDEYARQLLACGYATDPAYSAKLIMIMNTYGLREMAKEALASMAIEQWQKDVGFKAIDELARAGLVANPDDWKTRIEDETPLWLFFEMMRRINARIK